MLSYLAVFELKDVDWSTFTGKDDIIVVQLGQLDDLDQRQSSSCLECLEMLSPGQQFLFLCVRLFLVDREFAGENEIGSVLFYIAIA
jgi:hypothetical protein